MSLNKVIVMGRMTRDPELRHTNTNTAVTSFSLAVDRDYTPKGSEKITDFLDVVAWHSTAEFVCRHFTKGKQMIVVGHLQSRKWQDKNGTTQYSTEIIAESIYFCDSKNAGKQEPTSADATGGFEELDEYSEDDLPY